MKACPFDAIHIVDGVAVVSAIFAAEDPGAATEHLKTLAAEMVSHE